MLVRLGSLISGNIELTPRPIARMAKSADAADLKSAVLKRTWGFKSPSGHHKPKDECKWSTRLGWPFCLLLICGSFRMCKKLAFHISLNRKESLSLLPLAFLSGTLAGLQ